MKKTEYFLERRLLFRLPVLANLYSDWLAQMYKPAYGISIQQWHTLSIIGRYSAISPTEISEISTMSAFKVSRNISKLEDEGWVGRQINRLDKRQVELTLTKSGQEIYDQIESAAQMLEEKLNEVLSGSEQGELSKILDKLEPHCREIVLSHRWVDGELLNVTDDKTEGDDRPEANRIKIG